MSEENKQEQSAKPAKKFDFNVMIFELWNGKLPLLKVFWLYYFAVIFVLTALGNMLGALATVIGLFKIIWAGFMVKPIWVASDNYKGPQHWAMLAKVAAVLIGLAVIGDILAF